MMPDDDLPTAPRVVTPGEVAEAVAQRLQRSRERAPLEGPRQPYPAWLPKPPEEDGEDDSAEGWALYAAELFRARGDWRMVRAAASVATALAAADL